MVSLDLYPTSPLQNGAVAIVFIMFALTAVVFGTRIYCRMADKQLGIDDLLVSIAMVFEIVQTIIFYMSIRTLFVGIHVQDIPAGLSEETGHKWSFAAQMVYNPILALVKLSVLSFLCRLGAGGGLKPAIRNCIRAVGAVTFVQMLVIFVVVPLQCRPISYFWTGAEGGTCIDTAAFYISTAIITVVTDIVVLALPIWVFLGLQMPARIKLIVIGLFLLGGLTTVISMVRLQRIVQMSYYPDKADPTYDISVVFTQVETCLAIITSCGPSLKSLLKAWFPGLFKSGATAPHDASKYNSSSAYGRLGTRTTASSGPSKTNTTRSLRNAGVLPAKAQSFALKDLRSPRAEREIRNESPTGSQEEIMTYHGIMRTTEYTIQYAGRDSTHVEEGRRIDLPDSYLGLGAAKYDSESDSG